MLIFFRWTAIFLNSTVVVTPQIDLFPEELSIANVNCLPSKIHIFTEKHGGEGSFAFVNS